MSICVTTGEGRQLERNCYMAYDLKTTWIKNSLQVLAGTVLKSKDEYSIRHFQLLYKSNYKRALCSFLHSKKMFPLPIREKSALLPNE